MERKQNKLPYLDKLTNNFYQPKLAFIFKQLFVSSRQGFVVSTALLSLLLKKLASHFF
jgi:hypothetical protein